MAWLLDTSVAIPVRDGVVYLERLDALGEPPFLSAISRIELENGVYRDPAWSAVRRARLDAMLARMPTLDFDAAAIDAYRGIVAAIGYSRPRTFDRMIAATALSHGLVLITSNGRDFADIPGLKLEAWPPP